MDMTKIDLATATPLDPVPADAPGSPAGHLLLGALFLIVALSIMALRLFGALLWRDVRALGRLARMCGEEVAKARRSA